MQSVFRILAYISRGAALILTALVVLLCFTTAARMNVGPIIDIISANTSVFSGLYVLTPFGGMFRGDLALLACMLFVGDWALLRIAYQRRR